MTGFLQHYPKSLAFFLLQENSIIRMKIYAIRMTFKQMRYSHINFI